MICQVIDFQSQEENMYIAPHICQELDDLKAIYRQLPNVLTQVR